MKSIRLKLNPVVLHITKEELEAADRAAKKRMAEYHQELMDRAVEYQRRQALAAWWWGYSA